LYWIILQSIYLIFDIFYRGEILSHFIDYFKFISWALFGIIFYQLGLNDLIFNRSKLKSFNIKWLSKFGILFLVFIILRSFYIILNYNYANNKELAQELVNTNTYLILWLLPLLLINKSKINISILFLGIIVILLAAKRGPIIAIILSSLSVFFLNKRNRTIYLKVFILVSVFLFISYLILPEIFVKFFSKWSRESQYFDFAGNLTSSRSDFWSILVNKWLNGKYYQIIFGFGFFKVPSVLSENIGVDLFAHSDWIEIMYDNGLLGIFIFSLIHFSAIKSLRLAKFYNCKDTNLLIYIYLTYLFSNFYTQSTIGLQHCWFWIIFSFLLGRTYKEKSLKFFITQKSIQ
jgi:hypothetical protein